MLNKDTFEMIDEELDYALIDLIKIEEDGTTYFVPIFRFVNIDPETKKVISGITMKTGIMTSSVFDAADRISKLYEDGFFLQSLSSKGTIFDSDMNAIEEINWNQTTYLQRLKVEDMIKQ